MNKSIINKNISHVTPAEFFIPQRRATDRITALWALSEAGLGGILHAFKIPFTGLIIGSSAVIFMTLLACFSDKKNTILRATLLVLIVKGFVSPHTPFTAYLAVGLQGLFGEFIFRWIKYPGIAAPLLGALALFQSGIQKIIILTVVFGNNLWNSIDLFTNYILGQLFISINYSFPMSISALFIVLYVGIHVAAGVSAGIWAPLFSAKIKNELKNKPALLNLPADADKTNNNPKKKKRKRPWHKFSNMMLLLIISSILILSYIFPVFEKNQGTAALLMAARSVLVMTVWYFILGPLMITKLRSYLNRKKMHYSPEIESIIGLFPLFRKIIRQSWTVSGNEKGIGRIDRFMTLLFLQILTVETTADDIKDSSGT
ncbi:MAG: hypothetical protein AB7T22_14530 [Calditrichaceae bacterium]